MTEDRGHDAAARPLQRALREASARLAAAGVVSARRDALILAAEAASRAAGEEISPGRLEVLAITGDAVEPEGFEELIEQRAQRIPLQHLTGSAPFRHLRLRVGPGVFVPRPETELLVDQLHEHVNRRGIRRPVVVDLATGSGAVALSVAAEIPEARVWAVELSPQALAWARQNAEALERAEGRKITLVEGDAARALPELEGAVDAVLSNPPYIPETMVPKDPEVAEHDPPMALYGGSADGLAVPRAFVRRAAELLRPGGLLVMEHAEVQAEALRGILAEAGFTDVETVRDLTGRDRAVRGYAGEAASGAAPEAEHEAREAST